jgi:hypothetical protein
MRCDDFDKVACELARDSLIDVALRARALSHAAACSPCASMLAGERYLNEALAIAAGAETECAPPSVRLSLLQSFSGGIGTAPPREVPSAKRSRWYLVAAAAALVVMASLVSVRMIIRRHPATALQPAMDEKVSLNRTTPQGSRPVAPGPSPGGRKPAIGLGRALRHRREAPGYSPPSADVDGAQSKSEPLSEFIPLTHLSSATAIESGQVIRVKVPLSTFLALGLPISPEHADQLVNAELVVGDDGVQRAVRLVR